MRTSLRGLTQVRTAYGKTMKPQISYVHCPQVLTTIIVVDQKVLALPGLSIFELDQERFRMPDLLSYTHC